MGCRRRRSQRKLAELSSSKQSGTFRGTQDRRTTLLPHATKRFLVPVILFVFVVDDDCWSWRATHRKRPPEVERGGSFFFVRSQEIRSKLRRAETDVWKPSHTRVFEYKHSYTPVAGGSTIKRCEGKAEVLLLFLRSFRPIGLPPPSWLKSVCAVLFHLGENRGTAKATFPDTESKSFHG